MFQFLPLVRRKVYNHWKDQENPQRGAKMPIMQYGIKIVGSGIIIRY